MIRVLISSFFISFGCIITLNAETPTTWEWTPYKVHAWVVASDSAASSFPNDISGELSASLEPLVRQWLGRFWEFQAESAVGGVRTEILRNWENLNAEGWIEKHENGDKVFFVLVDLEKGEPCIRIRELDLKTRLFGGEHFASVPNSKLITQTAVMAMCEAFSPLALIERVENESAMIVLRAAELRPNFEFGESLKPGNVFVPVVRVLDRDGTCKQVARVPWTALSFESQNGSRVVSRVESGLRSPLSTRRRGRVEQLAIRLKLPENSTQLHLISKVTSDEGPISLPQYQIFEKNRDEENGTMIGMTDFGGRFELPPNPDRELRTLYVRQGKVLLARLPIIRGIDSECEVAIPDAPVRLAAEAVLRGIQEKLIDHLARREVLLARYAAQEADGDYDGLAKTNDELVRLKNIRDYLLQLDIEQTKYRSDDPVVQRRIDKMFEETRKMVRAYMSRTGVSG